MMESKYTIVDSSFVRVGTKARFASYETPYLCTAKFFEANLEDVRDWWADNRGLSKLTNVLSHQRCLHDEDPSSSLLTQLEI